MPYICDECHQEYTPVRRFDERRFCSPKCKSEWHRKWSQTPHPVYAEVPWPHPEFYELVEARETYIRAEKADPWRYGIQPAHWKLADSLWDESSEMMVSGGNRSGKTLWAALQVVKAILAKEKASVICCHTSSQSSVTVQQPAVYNYLPVEFKGTKKGRVHYLNYSMKNGFTDSSFILPNASRVDFLNYTQSPNVIEGREADLVWCDELVPTAWLETLRFRLVTRRGKLLVTQTPLEGVASCYKEFTTGARITDWAKAELLGGKVAVPGWRPGDVPRIMRGPRGRNTVFFQTQDNPYNPYDEMASKLKGAPIGQILVRAYGWASDSIGKAFARFRPDVHCIPRDRIPAGGTLYQVVDPAGARNWFCLWALVFEDRTIIVREFPDFPGYGEWALPSDKADGRPGPAQTVGAGRGVSDYRHLFRQIETEIGRGEPMLRLIDPRAGGTPALSLEGGTTLVDLLAMSEDPQDEGMAFLPAPGVPTDQRIAAINDRLSWDSTQAMSGINQPRLYVVDDLENLIWALSEYTGRDGLKGATKDPVDCLGMLLTSPCEFVGAGGLASTGGGGY